MTPFVLSERVMQLKKRAKTSVAGEWRARIFILALSIFPYLVIVSSVPAQTATSVIRGTVQDSTGAIIVAGSIAYDGFARRSSSRLGFGDWQE
jgi:hypothetical protein